MAIELSKKQIKEGWQVVKFGDIAKEVKNSTKTPLEDGLEFYIGLEHLDPQSLGIQRKGIIADDSPSFTRVFKTGQILFGKRRCYQKKAAVANFEGICSGDIIVMEAIKGRIVSGLLPFIVQSDMFFDWAEKTSSGSLSPRTKWKALAEFEFSLPTIERQKEILEVLEKVEKVRLKYDNLKESIVTTLITTLIHLFNKKPIKYEQLEQVANVFAGKNKAIDKSLDSGIKMLTLPCVNEHCEFSIDNSSTTYIASQYVEKKDYLKKNDILFNWRNGSQRHIGKVAFIEEDINYVHVGFFLRIRPDNFAISPKYLYWYLRYLKHTEFFLSAKQQVNRTFNKGELSRLDIARYKMKIEKKVEHLLEYISAEKKVIDQNSKVYMTFRNKLLNNILTGELSK